MIKFGVDERRPECMACEEMLADVLDGTLSAADQAWFDRHIAVCGECSQRLADAQRGAAWLEMLKSPRPEPSVDLMDRILAATSSAETTHLPQMQPAAMPVIPHSFPQKPGRILPFRMPLPRFKTPWLEPRLAMTAAMAFFSVALTLNLAGVKLNELHASDLSPTNLKRTYYEANAGVSRYYENLRVVRVMESRVEDMRQAVDDSEDQQRPAPESEPAEKPAPKEDQQKQQDGHGVSRRDLPLAEPRGYVAEPRRKNRTMEGGLA
jgi:Putative zinc-finger